MDLRKTPAIECKDRYCFLRNGEECTLTLETYEELESNDTLCNLSCMQTYYQQQDIKQRLEEEAGAMPEKQEETLKGDIVPPYSTYREYKEALDGEIRKEAEGFVRIGYLLKLARDTSILAESGYANLYDFAQAEYHLDRSRVSRFIGINDRFSADGYSAELIPQYRGFGVAKLAVMLTLPDAVNEELTPEYSRSEIDTIKKEIEEEQKVTDIERMLESPEIPDEGIRRIIRQLGEDEPELFLQVHSLIKEGSSAALAEAMAPDGEKTYSVRLRGTGRMLLFVKEDAVAAVNARTSEKNTYTWEQVVNAWEALVTDQPAKENWEDLYGMEFPAVEPKTQRKAPKVTKAKSEPGKKEKEGRKEAVAPVQPETKEKEESGQVQQEEQIPGQAEIEDHPECLPDPQEEAIQPETEEVEGGDTPESPIKTEEEAARQENNEVQQEPVMPEAEWEERVSEAKTEALRLIDSAKSDVAEHSLYLLARSKLEEAITYLDRLLELEEIEIEEW